MEHAMNDHNTWTGGGNFARELFRAHVQKPRSGVWWHYRTGKLAAACRPRGDKRDHRAWVVRLAKECGLSHPMVYDCMRFTKRFSPEEAERLARRDLRWHKIRQLMAIKDPDARAAAVRD